MPQPAHIVRPDDLDIWCSNKNQVYAIDMNDALPRPPSWEAVFCHDCPGCGDSLPFNRDFKDLKWRLGAEGHSIA